MQNTQLAQVFCFCAIALSCSMDLSNSLGEDESPRLESQQILDDALKQARAEHKRVYFLETGDNCGPCVYMLRFLEQYEPLLRQDFVVVKIKRPSDGAKDPVTSRIRAGKPGGIPWSAILDVDGTVLATSNDGNGKNLGFPHEQHGADCYVNMLRSGSQRITPNQLQEMADALTYWTIIREVKKEREAAKAKAKVQVKVDGEDQSESPLIRPRP